MIDQKDTDRQQAIQHDEKEIKRKKGSLSWESLDENTVIDFIDTYLSSKDGILVFTSPEKGFYGQRPGSCFDLSRGDTQGIAEVVDAKFPSNITDYANYCYKLLNNIFSALFESLNPDEWTLKNDIFQAIKNKIVGFKNGHDDFFNQFEKDEKENKKIIGAKLLVGIFDAMSLRFESDLSQEENKSICNIYNFITQIRKNVGSFFVKELIEKNGLKPLSKRKLEDIFRKFKVNQAHILDGDKNLYNDYLKQLIDLVNLYSNDEELFEFICSSLPTMIHFGRESCYLPNLSTFLSEFLTIRSIIDKKINAGEDKLLKDFKSVFDKVAAKVFLQFISLSSLTKKNIGLAQKILQTLDAELTEPEKYLIKLKLNFISKSSPLEEKTKRTYVFASPDVVQAQYRVRNQKLIETKLINLLSQFIKKDPEICKKPNNKIGELLWLLVNFVDTNKGRFGNKFFLEKAKDVIPLIFYQAIPLVSDLKICEKCLKKADFIQDKEGITQKIVEARMLRSIDADKSTKNKFLCYSKNKYLTAKGIFSLNLRKNNVLRLCSSNEKNATVLFQDFNRNPKFAIKGNDGIIYTKNEFEKWKSTQRKQKLYKINEKIKGINEDVFMFLHFLGEKLGISFKDAEACGNYYSQECAGLADMLLQGTCILDESNDFYVSAMSKEKFALITYRDGQIFFESRCENIQLTSSSNRQKEFKGIVRSTLAFNLNDCNGFLLKPEEIKITGEHASQITNIIMNDSVEISGDNNNLTVTPITRKVLNFGNENFFASLANKIFKKIPIFNDDFKPNSSSIIHDKAIYIKSESGSGLKKCCDNIRLMIRNSSNQEIGFNFSLKNDSEFEKKPEALLKQELQLDELSLSPSLINFGIDLLNGCDVTDHKGQELNFFSAKVVISKTPNSYRTFGEVMIEVSDVIFSNENGKKNIIGKFTLFFSPGKSSTYEKFSRIDYAMIEGEDLEGIICNANHTLSPPPVSNFLSYKNESYDQDEQEFFDGICHSKKTDVLNTISDDRIYRFLAKSSKDQFCIILDLLSPDKYRRIFKSYLEVVSSLNEKDGTKLLFDDFMLFAKCLKRYVFSTRNEEERAFLVDCVVNQVRQFKDNCKLDSLIGTTRGQIEENLEYLKRELSLIPELKPVYLELLSAINIQYANLRRKEDQKKYCFQIDGNTKIDAAGHLTKMINNGQSLLFSPKKSQVSPEKKHDIQAETKGSNPQQPPPNQLLNEVTQRDMKAYSQGLLGKIYMAYVSAVEMSSTDLRFKLQNANVQNLPDIITMYIVSRQAKNEYTSILSRLFESRSKTQKIKAMQILHKFIADDKGGFGEKALQTINKELTDAGISPGTLSGKVGMVYNKIVELINNQSGVNTITQTSSIPKN